MKIITQFTSIYAFATNRLIAQKVQQSDLDKFRSMYTNAEVMRTLGGLRNEQQTVEDLNHNLKHWQDNGFGLWMFYLKATGEWVGRAGLRRVTINENEKIEVSYTVLPPFWNKGLATEMTNACLEIAFEVIRLDDLVCFTRPSNKASRRVMDKVGFKFEREIIYANLPHILYQMKNPRTVKVISYNNRWPDLFRQEAVRIQTILGSHIKEIHHIGSTAIPNMAAKPVIDMLLECDTLDEIDRITEKLAVLNYYNIRRQIIPHLSFFTRRQDEDIGFNLHLHERGSPQIKRHVNFRDYLIHHPEEAEAYAALKKQLAAKFTHDMNSYVFGKDKFVQAIDTKAKRWAQRKNNYLSANTGPPAKEWSQEKVIKAMAANLNMHMTYFAQYLDHVELIRVPGFTIVNSGLADDTFNYVVDADFSAVEAPKKIAEVTRYFMQNNTPFSWWISPYDKPDELDKYLVNENYYNTENNIAMYFDLDEWDGCISIPEQLKIIQAKDEKTLQDFALVLTNDEAAFKTYFSWIASVLTDDDPIEYYVGYVNEKPVVRGLACYFGQVAGLHWLSTSPLARKKGYGAAMQQFRLKRAKELGYHVAVLQASSKGYPLYKRLGYKECGMFKEFKLIDSHSRQSGNLDSQS